MVKGELRLRKCQQPSSLISKALHLILKGLRLLLETLIILSEREKTKLQNEDMSLNE